MIDIDQIVNELDKRPANTGMVLGMINGGEQSIYGYGKTKDNENRPPDEDTLFEIGSVTKVFTAALLALLIEDGKLGLEDPVQKMMPELSNLPPEVTLLQLASHTSGLPKMPSNIYRSMLKDRHDPFAAYTMEEMMAAVDKFKFNKKKTETVNYSNLGAALLGQILARRAGKTYEQIVKELICDPLEMGDTGIQLTEEQKTRLAWPHNAKGKKAQNWNPGPMEPAGAIRSTVNDLLKFLATNLGSDTAEMIKNLEICHEIQTTNYPPPSRLQKALMRDNDFGRYRQGIGLAWHVGQLREKSNLIHWHHGATGGYRSFIGFVKSTGIGVVVLANRSPSFVDGLTNSTTADEIGFRVLEILNQ